MAIGYYSQLYESAISPWTTLGPLAFVIGVSLLVEGAADMKRHRSDEQTNKAPCVILQRAENIDNDENAERETTILGGKDVVVNLSKLYFMTSTNKTPSTPQHATAAGASAKSNLVRVGFQTIKRMDIRQGHIVLIKNREMVPADTVLLASSGENGGAYIETSSIDGETNLKLRTSPHLPHKLLKHLRDGTPMEEIPEMATDDEDEPGVLESIEQAAKRITRFSALAYPDGTSAMDYPGYLNKGDVDDGEESRRRLFSPISNRVLSPLGRSGDVGRRGSFAGEDKVDTTDTRYVAALTSEPPNPHVNTFSGKLTLPPVEAGGSCIDIPLGADNILLRGAVLRNTEWAIGISCFTGTDTKLVQNSFQTPSKFSQLDVLMNKCVGIIIVVMVLCITYLATNAVIAMNQEFDMIWYLGFNTNTTTNWPYLPRDLAAPQWITTAQNWLQMFFLYVTLLSNFVPLSMYVTVEMINFFFLWLVYADLQMYDAKSDTRAAARSTNVTDLGQVQYIFSDKTGTLTQNVMRFKRCSVDGIVFGAPVRKARPGADAQEDAGTSFHPLRQLLVGHINVDGTGTRVEAGEAMTFNAEMFLRVMSLCHTVVVEKDLDMTDNIEDSKSVGSVSSGWSARNYTKKLFASKRDRTISDMSASSALPSHGLEPVAETPGSSVVEHPSNGPRARTASAGSVAFSQFDPNEKGQDGAPAGFAYQAESPDEGALVSEASSTFGFQVVGRDSSGIKILVDRPTIFSDQAVAAGLKSGALNPKQLAADSATGHIKVERNTEAELLDENGKRTETWSILAVNKFDSDRKRMSILLRAPPELGSVVILFCKGADSAMLDPAVCSASPALLSGHSEVDLERSFKMEVVTEDEDTEWEMAQMLGIQSHLGEFATEGLRTLVLGVRFLTEAQCAAWLETHKMAATSIKDRDGKLKAAALEIETNIHIVGATAIEDKLQTGVPDTIATLEKAGIKLWVLTGDKRETAIEIGYSTHVLTPKMHLTEMADKGEEFVRAQCAMEFMRLVKAGKLPLYQRAAVDQSDDSWNRENFSYVIGKCLRFLSRMCRRLILTVRLFIHKLFGGDPGGLEESLESIKDEEGTESEILKDVVRRRNVRDRAERVIRDYMAVHEHEMSGKSEKPMSPAFDLESTELSTDDLPSVFNRAQSARSLLEKRSSQGKLTSSDKRNIKLAQLTAQEAEAHKDQPLIDEDMLSLASFRPATGDAASDFDRKRRSVLERMFAVDKDVRKGRLVKHLKKEKRAELLLAPATEHHAISPSGEGPRALVIEGAALKHLLGDLELEELVFNIASQCDAVIACRVSPRQKALLVKLVRQRVVPEPVTLAIGDGANDVGMIQEAHVGVGISGKEGKQAVNASDFAIAQFRFLETLVLIHGRWDFMRLSIVVLYSFYKNAVMAGCLVVYNGNTLFSGTPLFDQWAIAVLNFVAGLPILLLGMFDRCLEKDYIFRNPEVYKPSRDNELITLRVLFRWVILAFVHIFVLYYGSLPQLTGAGGMTSAFVGLMWNKDVVGNGEGGDLQSVGQVVFTSMIFLLAYKILYESRSIINGRWPAIACGNKNAKEGTGLLGFFSRLPYTWYGVTYGSILFNLFFLFIYQLIGEKGGPGQYFAMVGVVTRIFGTRSINYISILFVPTIGMVFDTSGKVFSNMFYPTQTQIHVELEAKEFAEKKQEARRRRKELRTNGQSDGEANRQVNGELPATNDV